MDDRDKNTNNIKRKRGLKNKKLRNLFIRIVLIIVIALLAVVYVFGMKIMKARNTAKESMEAVSLGSKVEVFVDPETGEEVYEEIPAEEYKINVAVFGTDSDGYRTDVSFLLSYDKYNSQLALISIPRDTRVKMTDEIIESIESRNGNVPYRDNEKGVCKFNEVHAYAGKGYRNEFSVKMLEDMFGIEIDGYLNIDLEGFRNIVDAFGGVDMVVEDRLYYVDPYQDLYIDLYPGYQHLDGEKAEQLVRYREGYAQKDLKRIQVQQTFMKELMAKIVNTENIMNNLPSIIYNMFKYVETDLTITEFVEYASYMEYISIDSVYMETIPGEGGAYFWADEEGLSELSNRIFYSHDIFPSDTSEETVIDSHIPEGEARIEISNGSEKADLAASEKEFIESKGYYVSFISTYTGEKKENTLIIIGSDEFLDDAEGIAKFYNGAEIVSDKSMLSTGTDIRIILGVKEA